MKTKNLLLYAGLAAVGWFLWKKKQESDAAKVTAAAITQASRSTLPTTGDVASIQIQ